jgi:hypothetical protein
MKTVAIALGLALLCAGCGQPSGSGVKPAQPDANAIFWRFVPQFLSELQKYQIEVWNAADPTTRDQKPYEFLTDKDRVALRQTDSLVNPYDGIITYSYLTRSRYGHVSTMTWELHLSFEDGKWTPYTAINVENGRSIHINASAKSWWIAYERVKQ